MHRSSIPRWLLPAVLQAPMLLGAAAVAHTPPVPPSPGADEMLVGVLVAGHEVGTLDVRVAEDGYLIPVEAFARLTGCRVGSAGQELWLDTPLGEVRLVPTDLHDADGTLYLREDAIEAKLATPVEFDRSRYALRFDVPWRTDEAAHVESAASRSPDVLAPAASLSTVYADLRYTRVGETDTVRGATNLGGALAGGYWRLRYESDLEGQHYLRDYAWLYRGDDHLVLAGDQRVRVHPLLRGLEFTGVQYATTNQPLDLFSTGPAPSELLSRQMQPISTFDGQGPPAGVAELWINGVIVERQAIGLDGRYAFVDVSIPARQASQTEVRLYDRHNPGVPVEILEDVRTASAFLLPGGAAVHMAGVGVGGNLVQDRWLGIDEHRGSAGFYQTRHGLSDRVTVEAAIQGADRGGQIYGGLVSRLSRAFVLSAGVGGSSESAFGYSLELEGLPRPWRILGRLQASEAGFDPVDPQEQRDHSLELGRSFGTRLDVALVGRSRRNSTTDVDFLLPAATWRPVRSLWLAARPDIDGDYRYDLNYRLGSRTRITVGSTKGRTFTEVWHDVRPGLSLSAAADTGGGLPDRYALLARGHGRSRWRPSWAVGPLFTDGEPGYLLDGRVILMPGIVGQARVESNTLGTGFAAADEPRFLLNVIADLGLARGRLVASSAESVREGRGGIAGVVRVEAPQGFPAYDLANVPVTLDGRRVARTDASGQFFVGALPPGVYRVEVEPDNLPIELVPRVRSRIAQVGGAAVTRVDFVVRPEYGIAGRVASSDGAPAAGARVELVDSSRLVVARATTDSFGHYRVDGLPIGSYELRLEPFTRPGIGADGPSRIVRITDDFLFGQDLVLPPDGS